MHMADALVSPPVALTMYTLSGITAGYSVHKINKSSQPFEINGSKIPLMGVMGAFVFAAQMINFTIPGTGSSGHLCGGMLLSAILGPYCGFLTMTAVLLIQSLFFADGGLLALGCNIWNMGFYGCFAGALLVWRPLIKKSCNPAKIFTACIAGGILTLQFGAFSVTLQTLLSGITQLPFKIFVAAMQPVHLAIGTIEGLITATVLCFVYQTRKELLWGTIPDKAEGTEKISLKSTIAVLMIITVIIGTGLCLAASSNPDGLEWAVARTSPDGLADADSFFHQLSEKLQQKTAFLPDYSVKNHEQSAAGTSLSGLTGIIIIMSLTVIAAWITKLVKRKNKE